MTRVVAGHTFDDTHEPVCACGRAWTDIADCTEEHIGKHGFAHTQHLTSGELAEIRTERERRAALAERMWDALVGVSAR